MKKLHLLTYVMLALLYVGCSDDCDTPQIIKANSSFGYLPPYTGTDTLTFLHNNLDTQVYIGQGISQYWITEAGTDMECPKKYEGLTYSFKCNSNNNKIRFDYTTYTGPQGSGNGFDYYFNDLKVGNKIIPDFGQVINEIDINGTLYPNVRYYSNSSDTNIYFLVSALRNAKDLILKIQYPSDTLTILK